MKRLAMIILAMVASLAIAGSLYAASDEEYQTDMEPQSGAIENEAGDDYIGMAVLSEDGKKIGKIKQVALDETTGDIRFFTLSKGGVLGMGSEEVAVPYDALRFDEESAILTVDSAMLDKAPKQADFSAEEFMQRLETYYGAAPEWQEPDEELEMDEAESAEMD